MSQNTSIASSTKALRRETKPKLTISRTTLDYCSCPQLSRDLVARQLNHDAKTSANYYQATKSDRDAAMAFKTIRGLRVDPPAAEDEPVSAEATDDDDGHTLSAMAQVDLILISLYEVIINVTSSSIRSGPKRKRRSLSPTLRATLTRQLLELRQGWTPQWADLNWESVQ